MVLTVNPSAGILAYIFIFHARVTVCVVQSVKDPAKKIPQAFIDNRRSFGFLSVGSQFIGRLDGVLIL
jgi:hypothetical protein